VSDAYAFNDHVLRMSWYEATPLHLDADAILFTITVQSDVADILSLLSLDNTMLTAEAYLGADAQIVDLAFRAQVTDVIATEGRLYQNTPNPFVFDTEIPFVMTESGTGVLKIYSLSGQMMYEHTAQFQRGLNRIPLSAQALGLTRGVYVYQLQCEDFIKSRRMIVLD
jgi:hypothetical protein